MQFSDQSLTRILLQAYLTVLIGILKHLLHLASTSNSALAATLRAHSAHNRQIVVQFDSINCRCSSIVSTTSAQL
jgi:chorismate-pyruvate lyase